MMVPTLGLAVKPLSDTRGQEKEPLRAGGLEAAHRQESQQEHGRRSGAREEDFHSGYAVWTV